MTNEQVFKLATFLTSVTGTYHLIGIFYEVNSRTPAHHALFVLINAICIYGFIKRPKFFVFAFGALVIHQYYTHGGSLIRHWEAYHSINWIDFFIVLFAPIFLVYLIKDWRARFKSTV